jgi:hypothetical protein
MWPTRLESSKVEVNVRLAWRKSIHCHLIVVLLVVLGFECFGEVQNFVQSVSMVKTRYNWRREGQL